MTNHPTTPTADTTELEQFVRRCLEGLSHQVRGNSGPFLAVWSHADDVAILGAVGSYALGWDNVQSHLLGTSKRLDWSDLSVERLLTTAYGDLALTVVLEHMTREVDGQPDSRTLRTTQAYRREHGDWRLILRHANTITPEDEAQELALRGT